MHWLRVLMEKVKKLSIPHLEHFLMTATQDVLRCNLKFVGLHGR